MITTNKIWFENERIFANLNDGRIVGMPLIWFPRLENATEAQRLNYELWNDGSWIHWEDLDEDLSTEGFITFSKNSIETVLH